jgi:hypothetical protein
MLRHALAALLTAGLTAAGAGGAGAQARIGQPAPEVTGERWLNSDPLSMAGLRGRVVLIDFWTYG